MQLVRQRDRGGRRRRRTVRDRRAFTLVEMLVSLAVLTLTLSVVAVVFGITAQTASQAAAYSEVQGWLRQYMVQLEADLDGVVPSRSLLVLVGREQEAALSKDTLAAQQPYEFILSDGVNGDTPVDPRADILMFFTERAVASAAPIADPSVWSGVQYIRQSAYKAGTRFAPVQVVYGHASLANVDTSTSPPTVASGSLTHITNMSSGLSVLPLEEWWLARRQAIIQHIPDRLSFDSIVGYSIDNFDQITLNISKSNWPGDVALLDLDALLFGSQNFGDPDYVKLPPYSDRAGAGLPTSYNWGSDALIQQILYADYGPASPTHIATVLRDPPLELASNAALKMVPGCAWFQVEFLMPEDPRNSVEYSNPVPVSPTYAEPSEMGRWTEVPDGETYVFLPDSEDNRRLIADQATGPLNGTRLDMFKRLDQNTTPETAAEILAHRRIRLWPYAIRITVRAFDPQGRLESPIERTLIHRFD
jgi:prepilin-type N-terminal cleavage/methylation domain-containing protein